jgi:hypothetical protein
MNSCSPDFPGADDFRGFINADVLRHSSRSPCGPCAMRRGATNQGAIAVIRKDITAIRTSNGAGRGIRLTCSTLVAQARTS